MPITRETTERVLATIKGERAYKIVEALQDKCFETWWVGGCARDMLEGKIPSDIDIATAATPEEIRAVFPKTAKAPFYGSTRVRLGTDTFEVTTFREDDEASDGRHPEAVVFSTRERDAARRDFTINALYWHPISRELYDPFDGENDLKERLIRFIGEPYVRIRHDALRLLRAVRFRASVAGQYHPDTYRALQELAQMVEILSWTRQLEEFEKMLSCPHPDRTLQDLWDLRILHSMIPELASCKGIPQPKDYHHEGDVWDHILRCSRSFRLEDSRDVRLATVFHDIGKVQTFSLTERIRFDHHATVSAEGTEKVLRRLQCESRRIEKITWLIRHHMMMTSFIPLSDERKAHWYFHPWFQELLQLFFLDIAGTDPADFSLYESILRDYNRFLDTHPRPPKALLSGDEIMGILGIGPGERIGRILAQLHAEQVQGRITRKSEAKEFLQRLVQQ